MTTASSSASSSSALSSAAKAATTTAKISVLTDYSISIPSLSAEGSSSRREPALMVDWRHGSQSASWIGFPTLTSSLNDQGAVVRNTHHLMVGCGALYVYPLLGPFVYGQPFSPAKDWREQTTYLFCFAWPRHVNKAATSSGFSSCPGYFSIPFDGLPDTPQLATKAGQTVKGEWRSFREPQQNVYNSSTELEMSSVLVRIPSELIDSLKKDRSTLKAAFADLFASPELKQHLTDVQPEGEGRAWTTLMATSPISFDLFRSQFFASNKNAQPKPRPGLYFDNFHVHLAKAAKNNGLELRSAFTGSKVSVQVPCFTQTFFADFLASTTSIDAPLEITGSKRKEHPDAATDHEDKKVKAAATVAKETAASTTTESPAKDTQTVSAAAPAKAPASPAVVPAKPVQTTATSKTAATITASTLEAISDDPPVRTAATVAHVPAAAAVATQTEPVCLKLPEELGREVAEWEHQGQDTEMRAFLIQGSKGTLRVHGAAHLIAQLHQKASSLHALLKAETARANAAVLQADTRAADEEHRVLRIRQDAKEDNDSRLAALRDEHEAAILSLKQKHAAELRQAKEAADALVQEKAELTSNFKSTVSDLQRKLNAASGRGGISARDFHEFSSKLETFIQQETSNLISKIPTDPDNFGADDEGAARQPNGSSADEELFPSS